MILTSGLAIAAALAAPPTASPPSPPPPRVMLPPRLPPSPPPPPLPTPSAAARELALKILERVTLFDREAHSMVRNQLRWAGGACDFQNAECSRIAEEIAAR